MITVSLKCLRTGEEFAFPVTPFETFSYRSKIETQEIYGFGEIDCGASQQLGTWTIKSFFPHSDNNYYNFLSAENKGTYYYRSKLEEWLNNHEILEYRRSDNACYNSVDTSTYHCKCTIEKFEHGEEDGSRDVKFEIGFKEYRAVRLDGIEVYENTEVEYSSSTYTVKENDTILIIAQKVYGDSKKFKILMNKNGITNPLAIETDQVLKV